MLLGKYACQRIVQTAKTACLFRKRCSSRAFSLPGASHSFCRMGYVWVQLQRPRRLTFPTRFSIGHNRPDAHGSVGLSLALGHPSVHPRQTPTLSPDTERHEAQRRHWRERNGKAAGSGIVGHRRCSVQIGTLCVEWHRAPSHRTNMPHPQFLLPPVWDISIFSRCLPMAFLPLP